VKNNKKMKNIFADKATLILREMLCHPQKKWVTRGFTGRGGVSIGMSQAVLEAMARLGYIERIKRGPASYTILTDAKRLIENWKKGYSFELNEVDTYYTPDKNILTKLKNYLKDRQYALTLHTGANLRTFFVKTDHVYMYFESQNWNKDILDMRQRFDLKELVRGGNIHFIRPYYKKSVFFNSQMINGYKVVSNLQLYLDLFNFRPRGREHAEYLKKLLEEKGNRLD